MRYVLTRTSKTGSRNDFIRFSKLWCLLYFDANHSVSRHVSFWREIRVCRKSMMCLSLSVSDWEQNLTRESPEFIPEWDPFWFFICFIELRAMSKCHLDWTSYENDIVHSSRKTTKKSRIQSSPDFFFSRGRLRRTSIPNPDVRKESHYERETSNDTLQLNVLTLSRCICSPWDDRSRIRSYKLQRHNYVDSTSKCGLFLKMNERN